MFLKIFELLLLCSFRWSWTCGGGSFYLNSPEIFLKKEVSFGSKMLLLDWPRFIPLFSECQGTEMREMALPPLYFICLFVIYFLFFYLLFLMSLPLALSYRMMVQSETEGCFRKSLCQSGNSGGVNHNWFTTRGRKARILPMASSPEIFYFLFTCVVVLAKSLGIMSPFRR